MNRRTATPARPIPASTTAGGAGTGVVLAYRTWLIANPLEVSGTRISMRLIRSVLDAAKRSAPFDALPLGAPGTVTDRVIVPRNVAPLKNATEREAVPKLFCCISKPKILVDCESVMEAKLLLEPEKSTWPPGGGGLP